MIIQPPPWLQSDWQRIAGSPDRLHHGILLGGNLGIGKREFAVCLAQRLLCADSKTDTPCGSCQNCRLFVAGTHPDFHVLTSENETVYGRLSLLGQYSERYQDGAARDKKTNPAQVIPVDQIRRLIDRFYQSSHIAERRVAIVLPADRLNLSAANAFLKLLEEPPAGGHFILVTDRPGSLPSTIRSRCVLESLPTPSSETANQWLQQKGIDVSRLPAKQSGYMGPYALEEALESGHLDEQESYLKAVLALITGRQDPVALAASLNKQELPSLLQWMQYFVIDLIRWRSASQSPAWGAKSGIEISRINCQKLHGVYDKIAIYRSLAREQINPQLALEELTIALQRALRPS